MAFYLCLGHLYPIGHSRPFSILHIKHVMRVYWTTLKANLLGPEIWGVFSKMHWIWNRRRVSCSWRKFACRCFRCCRTKFRRHWLMYVVKTFDLRCENAAIQRCDKEIFSTPVDVVRTLWLQRYDLVFLQSCHNFLGVFKKLGIYSVLSNYTARYKSLYFKQSLFVIFIVLFCCLVE